MKTFNKVEVDMLREEAWRGGIKYTSYRAHVTIETDDAGLRDAILDQLSELEEVLTSDEG